MNKGILKSAFIIVMCTLLGTSVMGQSEPQIFRFGIKGQVNLAWMASVSKNIERNGVGFGFSYGLMFDYNFQQNYALNMELLITDVNTSMIHKDSLTFENKNYGSVKYDYRAKYIQIPISIKLKTKQIGNMTYWAQFGFAPSFLMRAQADISGTNPFEAKSPENIAVNKTAGDDFEFDNFDDKVFFARLPLIIGIGIEYRLAGNTSLYSGLRMDNSFSDVFVADKIANTRNNFVSLAAGFYF